MRPQAELLDVGDPYQDREADAALLVHHDPENDALLLVSSSGMHRNLEPHPTGHNGPPLAGAWTQVPPPPSRQEVTPARHGG